MRDFFKRHWFLSLLMVTLVVGIKGGPNLASYAAAVPRNFVVAAVLLAMALPLKIDAMWNSLRHPGPALLAVAINFVVVPLLAFVASWLLIDDLALGLIIATAQPCTLASAAVWTRMAGGNDAVSLLVTMITSVSCFLVTPAWIQLLAGQSDSFIDFSQMVLKLLALVVLPIVSAQLLRAIPAVGRWSTTHKSGLSSFAQLSLLTIVFIGAVRCGETLAELNGRLAAIAGQLLLMSALAAAIHVAAWWMGFVSAGKLGMDRANQLAVAFAGSQKTLMVGLVIALDYGGITMLPMLAYHVLQLVIDTLLADRCRKADENK